MTFEEIQKLMDLSTKVQRARYYADEARGASIITLAEQAVGSPERDAGSLVEEVRALFVARADRHLEEAIAEAKAAGIDAEQIPPMIGVGWGARAAQGRNYTSSGFAQEFPNTLVSA
jgi:hypothetical protein